jgi:hypothetical protein
LLDKGFLILYLSEKNSMITRPNKTEQETSPPQFMNIDHEQMHSVVEEDKDVHPAVLNFPKFNGLENVKDTKETKGAKDKVPEAKVENAPDSVVNDDGSLTISAAFTLSMLSGVPLETILACKIGIKKRGLTFPWYNANKGGGAITVGQHIYMTENFFDRTSYYHYMRKTRNGKVRKETSYGDSPIEWLYLLAHEVRHLEQGKAFGYDAVGTAKYLLKFTELYATSFGHDGASLEKTADEGMKVFDAIFITGGFVNSDFTILESLFNDPKLKDTDRLKQLEVLFQNPDFLKKIDDARKKFQQDHSKAYGSEKEILDQAAQERDQRKTKIYIEKN